MEGWIFLTAMLLVIALLASKVIKILKDIKTGD